MKLLFKQRFFHGLTHMIYMMNMIIPILQLKENYLGVIDFT